ncbi:nuclear pore complex protein NUP50A-like isoform X2 [Impatiens glandulifera]|uniref:nuclear pore complex protein NUP50A-like isoform X2 n=1 Tax=Impatiens glandulifera TaxID=253017 RepID=UPI001FB15949|nr:nuclear pore complex protein NUP50A-like isoform X2 [Impatiens glandulifera]
MGDAENNLPPSKKRAAGREISRDNPGLDDEEEDPGKEIGTFKRAPEEVLAGRRIVKVRRHQTSSSQSAPPSSNPFAGIKLITPGSSSFASPAAAFEIPNLKAVGEKDGKNDVNEESPKDETNKADEAGGGAATDDTKPVITNTENKTELEGKAEEAGPVEILNTVVEETKTELVNESAPEEDKTTEQDNNDDEEAAGVDKTKNDSPFSSFQQLSSNQNAFAGLTGTGFSSSAFSFGVINNGSQLGSSSSTVDLKSSNISTPFSFGISSSSGSSLFGDNSKSESRGVPSMQAVAVETGEEQEKSVFVADSILFQFIDGGWKERGKGEVKVNIPIDDGTGKGKGRMLMRTRGNYRLVLNASLYPDMKLANMEKKGITFSCINHPSEGEDGGNLSTFALKFKDATKVAEFREAVDEHKGKIAGSSSSAVLKTPENSPKEDE